MALAVYQKASGKNIAGNFHKLFLTEIDNVASITKTSDEVSAVTMESGKYFNLVTAEIDSVQFKSEGNGAANYYETQTLTMKFAKRDKSVDALVESITDAISGGLAAIRLDGNGKAFLIGYDDYAKDKKARPFNSIKVTYDSGLKPSDAEGNIVTVELTRESEWDEIPFTDTVSGYIATLNTDSAAFLNVTPA